MFEVIMTDWPQTGKKKKKGKKKKTYPQIQQAQRTNNK